MLAVAQMEHSILHRYWAESICPHPVQDYRCHPQVLALGWRALDLLLDLPLTLRKANYLASNVMYHNLVILVMAQIL